MHDITMPYQSSDRYQRRPYRAIRFFPSGRFVDLGPIDGGPSIEEILEEDLRAERSNMKSSVRKIRTSDVYMPNPEEAARRLERLLVWPIGPIEMISAREKRFGLFFC